MLAVCRRHCRERGLSTSLHHADMARFTLAASYEAVFVPAGSIRSLKGRDATMTALASCHRALTPGGVLYVDVVPPRASSAPRPMRYWRRDPHVWTLQMAHIEYDPLGNRTTEFLRYEKWRDGELLMTEMHPFCMQHWSLGEFDALLRAAGFTDIMVTADYQDHGTPSPSSHDWTFRATRPSRFGAAG
jgi:hypothetical protein